MAKQPSRALIVSLYECTHSSLNPDRCKSRQEHCSRIAQLSAAGGVVCSPVGGGSRFRAAVALVGLVGAPQAPITWQHGEARQASCLGDAHVKATG